MKKIKERILNLLSRKFILLVGATVLLWYGHIDQYVWLGIAAVWAGFSTVQKIHGVD